MARGPKVHVQVERHGITVAFQSHAEQIGDILDRVLSQLALLDRLHDLAGPPEVQQIGGYHPVDVPEDDEPFKDPGPVIWFR